jgi:predicted ATPase
MDAADFEFPADQIGRVLVTLIEGDGWRTSAYSASDGTLRFLGTLAALLGPESEPFFFLDELETGIHPTRLHLLLQLIEQRVAQRDIQVVATTHSPQLLDLISRETREHVSLIYRREGEKSAQIQRLLDLPHAQEILGEESLARLHASGWFEDAVAFAEPVAAE